MANQYLIETAIDDSTKLEAERVMAQIGTTPAQVIQALYRYAVSHGTLPRVFLPTQLQAQESALRMSQDWQDWLAENLTKKCNPDELAEILAKNQFSETTIALAMGDLYPTSRKACQSTIDYEALARCRITQTDISGAEKIVTDKLQLYVLDDFMTAAECEALIDIIRLKIRPSTITTPSHDTRFRTSSTCDLARMEAPLVQLIDQRISETLGISRHYSEEIQAQLYGVGQQFKAHMDFFHAGSEAYEKQTGARGNRTWTFMVYLNETTKGGGTEFLNIEKVFYPKIGRAVIWNNLYDDGAPNHDTIHRGMPVEAGEKLIITKWFREHGEGTMLL